MKPLSIIPTPQMNETPAPITAIATAKTPLKDFPHPSYRDCEYAFFVAEGTELLLTQYLSHGDIKHNFFLLAAQLDGTGRKGLWAYAPHWRITGTEPGNNPIEARGDAASLPAGDRVVLPELNGKPDKAPSSAPSPSKPEKKPEPYRFKVPGITKPVAVTDPIYWEGGKPSNFTWGEMTKGGRRVPVNVGITYNTINVAKRMDAIRSLLGDRAIRVTSGYRDPVSNAAVGGAKFSQHKEGNAIDFQVAGLSPVDVFYKIKTSKLCPPGLAVGRGFVHCDWRKSGRARWLYRGGPRVALW